MRYNSRFVGSSCKCVCGVYGGGGVELSKLLDAFKIPRFQSSFSLDFSLNQAKLPREILHLLLTS